MIRVICSGALVLLCAFTAHAIARADIAPVGLCYSLSGSTVETTVVGSGAYPFDIRIDVTDIPGGVEVVHRAVWVEVSEKVYLAGIMR